MEHNQVYKIVNSIPSLKQSFHGIVTPEDFEKSPPKFSSGFIILFIDNQPIGHYVALFKQKGRNFFFDSFGESPEYYSIKLVCSYNKARLQGAESCLCGPYILFCAYHSINKHEGPISSVIKKYFNFNDTKYNDSLTHSWVSQFKITNLKKCKL